MEAIRLIKPGDYDPRLGRFKSYVFQNSSSQRGGGISVIDLECATRTRGGVCEHIRRYYADVSGEPPLFWRFTTDILPPGCELEQQTTVSGDRCHYNLRHLPDREAKRLFKTHAADLAGIYMCGSDGLSHPTSSQLAELAASSWPNTE